MVSFCVPHNENGSRTRQFRPSPSACDRPPMTVRGGGVPTCFLGFQCRKGEWVRRFGASLPMRMTASWFGSLDPPNTRLWRDSSALERGLPSDRHLADPALLHSMVPPCSELSRPSPVGGRRRGDQP